MRYLIWTFRILLFFVLLGFALKNDQPVVLHYFFGYQWEASLVLILLIFFTAGAALGVLVMLFTLLRQRKELSALQKEIQSLSKHEESLK